MVRRHPGILACAPSCCAAARHTRPCRRMRWARCTACASSAGPGRSRQRSRKLRGRWCPSPCSRSHRQRGRKRRRPASSRALTRRRRHGQPAVALRCRCCAHSVGWRGGAQDRCRWQLGLGPHCGALHRGGYIVGAALSAPSCAKRHSPADRHTDAKAWITHGHKPWTPRPAPQRTAARAAARTCGPPPASRRCWHC